MPLDRRGHSPAILTHFGMGHPGQPKEFEIAVRADLPVGRDFQDHPLAAFIIRPKPFATPPPDFRHTNCYVRYSSGP